MDNNKGYSLVELMIVVAIIGILGTYATFNFSSGGAKLNQATRELFGNMQSLTILNANVVMPSSVQISEAIMMNSDNTTTNFTTYGYSSQGLNKPIVTGDTRPHQIRLKIPRNGNTPAKFKGVTLSFAGNAHVIMSDNGTSWQ